MVDSGFRAPILGLSVYSSGFRAFQFRVQAIVLEVSGGVGLFGLHRPCGDDAGANAIFHS